MKEFQRFRERQPQPAHEFAVVRDHVLELFADDSLLMNLGYDGYQRRVTREALPAFNEPFDISQSFGRNQASFGDNGQAVIGQLKKPGYHVQLYDNSNFEGDLAHALAVSEWFKNIDFCLDLRIVPPEVTQLPLNDLVKHLYEGVNLGDTEDVGLMRQTSLTPFIEAFPGKRARYTAHWVDQDTKLEFMVSTNIHSLVMGDDEMTTYLWRKLPLRKFGNTTVALYGVKPQKNELPNKPAPEEAANIVQGELVFQ